MTGMAFRLRTLLFMLVILPPLIWCGWAVWGRYLAWRERQLNQATGAVRIYVGPIGSPAPALPFSPESDYQYPPPSHEMFRAAPSD